MQEEIKRILRLVEDGKLTGEQASRMIDALQSAAAHIEAQASTAIEETAERADAKRSGTRRRQSDRGHDERRERHGSRRRRHYRHRHGFEHLFDDLGVDLQQAVGDAVRGVFKAAGGIGEEWVNSSNKLVFAKAEAPTGEHYKVDGNVIAVSQLGGLRFVEAEFCRNQMHGSATRDLNLEDAVFSGNALRGSSLKAVSVHNAEANDNQFNGAKVSRLTLCGGAFTNNAVSGAEIRALRLNESRIADLSLRGVKLKNVGLERSEFRDVRLSGVVASDWTLVGSSWCRVRLRGVVVDNLAAHDANLVDCVFAGYRGRRVEFPLNGSEAMPMRGLTLRNVTMKDCKFANCKFDDTTIENVDGVEGLRFKDVDFAGKTISSAPALAALASNADAA